MKTMSLSNYDNPKVITALTLVSGLKMTEADFCDLAIACLDQGGISARSQEIVSKMIGMEPLRVGEVDGVPGGQS